MKLCAQTMTVFNSRIDPATGDTDLYPSVISGISWFDEAAATVDPSTGLKAASKITVRIPENADFNGKQFIPPKSYPDADPDSFFTLDAGTLMILDVQETQKGLSLSALEKKYGRVVTVLAVTDNHRAPRAKHWKAVCA